MSNTNSGVDKSHENELRQWIVALPKAELHVHLEGTMLPATYARIAHRNGLAVADDIDALYRCDDFDSFLRSFLTVVKALQTPRDFAELTSEYLIRAASDGVRHVEFLISPATQRIFAPRLDFLSAVQAIREAADSAQAERGITSLLIIDIVRNLDIDEALKDVELAHSCRSRGVVGIGLGGDEARFPAREFRRAFARAEGLGLRRTAHAGEAAGSQSIVDAVELLNAERIGHGIAARGLPDIQRMLRERNVTIDACPTSNAFTRAIAGDERHPLAEWLKAGISVTLSSDDPAFFGASVSDEYMKAAELGLGRRALAQIARNGFAASFAGGESKDRWSAELDSYLSESGLTA